MFHKASTVFTHPDFHIQVCFADGKIKDYDMNPLFEQYPVFLPLKQTKGLFQQAMVDVGGFGIVWNDEIDLDSEEIYQNGKLIS